MAELPENIRKITDLSEHYPPLLREVDQPPAELYYRGNIALLQQAPLLAVVGSRRANHYGKRAVETLLTPLVAAGVPLVSGLAFGIDSLAHQLCLAHNQPTIAVLGSGLDRQSLYPKAHVALAEKIVQAGGVLISEYPPGTAAQLGYFPARNRIIAGLCQATVIVQAAQRSGSLITARLALEANRDVGAVPGPITDPLSAGTNALIRDGAHIVIEPADLLMLFGIEPAKPAVTREPLAPEQAAIFEHLSAEPQHINDLADISQLPAHQIAALLLEMELSGHVEHVGGMRYVRR